jgi:hypothetical protein
MSLMSSSMNISDMEENNNKSNINVPKLKGDNYSSWKVEFNNCMIRLNLHGVYKKEIH